MKELSILLIEDDPDDVLLIEELLLEKIDPEVRIIMKHSYDLESAFEHLASQKQDAVLLDLNLAKTHGIETLELFRAQHGHIPVIVLTTYQDPETALTALRKGATDYLVKGDFNSLLLVRTIRYAIERQQMLFRVEEDLKRQQQESEMQLLKEINNELSSKNEELIKAYKFKSEFLANVSHELKTPLNSILVAIDLLRENGGTFSDDQNKYVKLISRNGKDLLNLINDILDESKLESGKLEIENKRTSIKEIMNTLSDNFSDLAIRTNIDFKITKADDIPELIVTDQFRLEQILKNLLSNAFKFTHATGKVVLSVFIPADEDMISLPLGKYRTSPIIAFQVKDSGIGIPESKQQLIFNTFQQVDSTTSRNYGGSGLGLSISKKLANMLNGDLKLVSAEGDGSTFTLYLPQDVDEFSNVK